MTDMWGAFMSINEIGPCCNVKPNITRAVRGAGTNKFQLKFGELFTLEGVMFVPEILVNLISISALEDLGWGTMFRSGHVFLYPVGVKLFEAMLLGD
jgi:hypothetical protein